MKVVIVAHTTVGYPNLAESGYIDHYTRADDDPLQPEEYLPDAEYFTLNPEWEKWADKAYATGIDELHEAAGRGCYQSWNRPRAETALNEGYLGHIIDVAHESVLGHGHVTFWVEGVSRALLLELERHQQRNHLNFSVLSQRYVDQNKVGVVVPPLFNSEQAERLTAHYTASLELYDRAYNDLREAGHDLKAARGAARAFLPEATETRFFVTASIRGWRNVIRQRATTTADEEIRLFAIEVAKELAKIAPNSMQDIRRDLEL